MAEVGMHTMHMTFGTFVYLGFLCSSVNAQLGNSYDMEKIRITAGAVGLVFAVFLILGIIILCWARFATWQREKDERYRRQDNYAGSVFAVALEKGGVGHGHSVSGASYFSGDTSYAASQYSGYR